MKKYRHLFFDLDRTIWDFDTNNENTFRELYTHFLLKEKGIDNLAALYSRYKEINLPLWEAYKKGGITKEELNFERFHQSLVAFQIDDVTLSREIAAFYIAASPRQTQLYPGTKDTLSQLQQHYTMHIITNGFEEVQMVKMEKSGIMDYFTTIITSERAGQKKPHKDIFEFAIKEAGARVSESIIIGDDPEADILGGKLAGMDQLWIKHPPFKLPLTDATYEVEKIRDIIEIL